MQRNKLDTEIGDMAAAFCLDELFPTNPHAKQMWHDLRRVAQRIARGDRKALSVARKTLHTLLVAEEVEYIKPKEWSGALRWAVAAYDNVVAWEEAIRDGDAWSAGRHAFGFRGLQEYIMVYSVITHRLKSIRLSDANRRRGRSQKDAARQRGAEWQELLDAAHKRNRNLAYDDLCKNLANKLAKQGTKVGWTVIKARTDNPRTRKSRT